MEIKIIRKSELTTANWSGGTTTQLYIYPENTIYGDRDFIFRLSSARVDIEKSTFTSLPGVKRGIMVLDGKMKLVHTNQYSTILHKFNTDSFHGSWETSSFGKVTDYNLMTTGNASGELRALKMQEKDGCLKPISSDLDVVALYIYSGKIEVSLQQKDYLLEKGDSILFFNRRTQQELSLQSISDSEIIISEIVF